MKNLRFCDADQEIGFSENPHLSIQKPGFSSVRDRHALRNRVTSPNSWLI